MPCECAPSLTRLLAARGEAFGESYGVICLANVISYGPQVYLRWVDLQNPISSGMTIGSRLPLLMLWQRAPSIDRVGYDKMKKRAAGFIEILGTIRVGTFAKFDP